MTQTLTPRVFLLIVLLLALRTTFGVAAYAEPFDCSPNLIDKDICQHSLVLERELNKGLPDRLSAGLSIDRVVSSDFGVIFVVFKTHQELVARNKIQHMLTDQHSAREKMFAEYRKGICGLPLLSSFSRLGGVILISLEDRLGQRYARGTHAIGYCEKT